MEIMETKAEFKINFDNVMEKLDKVLQKLQK